MSAGSDYQKLRAHLAFLRMTAAAEALPALLEEATTAKLSSQELVERLLSVEVDAVDERRRASLARFASLPSPFTLADFDFSAQPSVDNKLIAELATLRFVEDATNVLFIGPPGVGKTMLAVGLGHAWKCQVQLAPPRWLDLAPPIGALHCVSSQMFTESDE